MIKAIAYTSKTGHTKEYARLLGEKTGLPVYEAKEAKKVLAEGTEIIYLGWLMAGEIKGLKKIRKKFCCRVICGVGMTDSDTQKAEAIKLNGIPAETPLFILGGGFEMEKLTGMYRLMMKSMEKTLAASVEKKAHRTPEEEDMLDLIRNGGARLDEDKLAAVAEACGSMLG